MTQASNASTSSTNLDFAETLWKSADTLRGQVGATSATAPTYLRSSARKAMSPRKWG
jgi:hypothetical protein